MTQTKVTPSDIYNPVKFNAYLSTTATPSAGTWTKVNLNSTLFDTSSNFNTSTFKFIAPVAGFLLL